MKVVFSIQDCKYDLRDVCKLTVQKELKVNVFLLFLLWDNANINLRMCNLLLVFKRMIYKTINGYKCE